MKKTLIVLVLLISIAGFAAADTTGFHSMPVDRLSGAMGFVSEGQSFSMTYNDGTADSVLSFGETGLTFQSIQVLGDHEGGLLNFYAKEQFAYMFGGSVNNGGVVQTVTAAEGYFGTATFGISTNLPTFVQDLEIMVGAGYHMDAGYALMLWNNGNDGNAILDLSLLGVGFNVLADWMLLGEIGITLGVDVSVDLWGLTIPLTALASNVETLNPAVGVNFDIAVGVSIPNDLAEEL